MTTVEVLKLIERVANLEKELEEKNDDLHRKNRALEIAGALDKVRARTINMRSSSELSETSALLFHQLKGLGIQVIRTGVGVFDNDYDAIEIWVTMASDNQEVIRVLDYFSLHIHPVFENIIPAIKENKPFSVTVLKDNEVRYFYETMSTYLTPLPNQSYPQEEYFYSFFFAQGTLNVNTIQGLTEEECSIVIRFAQVFGLTYTRFLDLQKAESQTREALTQQSLDSVRAEIASMRTAQDLERITPLIWQELVNLGVEFFRCGVFIINEEEQVVHAYLSTPQGKSLGVLKLPFDGLETTRRIVENWREGTVYREYWDREQFKSWVQSMVKLEQITEIEKFQASDSPIESLNLQFTPFTQGMLYVGSNEYLHPVQVDLVKLLANSFAVAYARYEDFKQLEAAKTRVEATLSELKATQSQLIQSEKMASLGQLTAGIAHEIQNPLNFVNNFSEVSAELIFEIQEARGKNQDKINFELENEILDAIKQNLEKISHHGKRADSIVKGMLQHSRASSGEKVPTDINALADEYLRLAFHGFRAKDKSFSAEYKTDFDLNLPKVNVVPQNMGRVLLNIINNAFQACGERLALSKAEESQSVYIEHRKREKGIETGAQDEPNPNFPIHFSPQVKISTKNLGDKIEISVSDNGTGIPDSIKAKIFQPFFTTKPTGEGTGLGLSLSYDIVKAQGGEIKVESEEGKGANFTITLPVY